MTAVGFSDLSVKSENGTFIVEARSPDNGVLHLQDGSTLENEVKTGQFQGGFRYQLLEALSRNVRWEQWQGSGEFSPLQLYVSDDGWTVIHTHGYVQNDLIAISPDGKRRGAVHVKPDFFEIAAVKWLKTSLGGFTLKLRSLMGIQSAAPEPRPTTYRNRNVHHTTAGLSWTMGSFHYFYSSKGRPYFVMVTCWGDRVIMDLEDGVLAELDSDGREYEENFMGRYLEKAANNMVDYDCLIEHENHEDTGLWSQWQDLEGILGNVARTTPDATIPLLHKINERRMRCGDLSCHALPEYFEACRHAFRCQTKLALRLLGEAPEERACFTFFQNDFANLRRILLELPDPVPDRDNLIHSISESMNSREVLQRLGSPDLRDNFSVKGRRFYEWGEHWDYFYGTGPAISSLRISWKEGSEGKEMTGFEHLSPLSSAQIDQRITKLTSNGYL